MWLQYAITLIIVHMRLVSPLTALGHCPAAWFGTLVARGNCALCVYAPSHIHKHTHTCTHMYIYKVKWIKVFGDTLVFPFGYSFTDVICYIRCGRARRFLATAEVVQLGPDKIWWSVLLYLHYSKTPELMVHTNIIQLWLYFLSACCC